MVHGVVDDHGVELIGIRQLHTSRLQPALPLFGGLRPPTDQTVDELVPRWRGEKDLRGLRICLTHLAGTLKIDFKDDGAIVRNRFLNGFAWGAVSVAVVDDGPLQQPVTVDKLVELRRGDEVVIDAVTLSGARRTARGGDGTTRRPPFPCRRPLALRRQPP